MPIGKSEIDLINLTGKAVRVAVANGADVNKPIGNGSPPLDYAVVYGKEDAIDALLEAGANLDSRNKDGLTPLMTGVLAPWSLHVNFKILEKLLKAGADVNAKDQYGRTPLMVVVDEGRDFENEFTGEGLRVIDVLPQSLRTAPSKQQVLKFLIEKGADVNATDSDGCNSLTYALWRAAPNIIRLLRDSGATERKFKELELIKAASQGEKNKVHQLIAEGADVNAGSPKDRTTALMGAARNGHSDVVVRLLRAGANVNQTGRDGNTALSGAVQNYRLEAMKLLIGAGADLAWKDEHGNDLIAYCGNDKKLIKYLRSALEGVVVTQPAKRKRGIESFDLNAQVLMLKTPIDQAIEGFVNVSEAKVWKRDVYDKQVTLKPGSCLAFQLKDSQWTVIYRLVGFDNFNTDAMTISKNLKTCGVSYGVSDTADAISYQAFENGKLCESLECDENGRKFVSTVRSMAEDEITDVHAFTDEFFKAQSAFIPGLITFFCKPGSKFRVVFSGLLREDFARVDHIADKI